MNQKIGKIGGFLEKIGENRNDSKKIGKNRNLTPCKFKMSQQYYRVVN